MTRGWASVSIPLTLVGQVCFLMLSENLFFFFFNNILSTYNEEKDPVDI